jgi:hypothetical protein
MRNLTDSAGERINPGCGIFGGFYSIGFTQRLLAQKGYSGAERFFRYQDF